MSRYISARELIENGHHSLSIRRRLQAPSLYQYHDDEASDTGSDGGSTSNSGTRASSPPSSSSVCHDSSDGE
jgi:hypothetical protein